MYFLLSRMENLQFWLMLLGLLILVSFLVFVFVRILHFLAKKTLWPVGIATVVLLPALFPGARFVLFTIGCKPDSSVFSLILLILACQMSFCCCAIILSTRIAELRIKSAKALRIWKIVLWTVLCVALTALLFTEIALGVFLSVFGACFPNIS